jgi:cytoskeletal protein RodZ
MTIGKNRRSSQNRREIVWTIGIRCVVCSLITLMTLQAPIAEAQQDPAQHKAPVRTQTPAPTQEQALSAPPMMPADTSANADLNSLPSAPTPQSGASEPQEPAQQQGTPQQPVGTAAAPYEKPTGVPGSSPAGAVIAPAKQRRVRAIVVRMSIVIAAGAAVGAVVGLSRASHGQP